MNCRHRVHYIKFDIEQHTIHIVKGERSRFMTGHTPQGRLRFNRAYSRCLDATTNGNASMFCLESGVVTFECAHSTRAREAKAEAERAARRSRGGGDYVYAHHRR